MRIKHIVRSSCLVLLLSSFVGNAMAQEPVYSFSGDMALVSKYLWRGQRLTNDWSLQPSMTLGVDGFAFNAWGSMDLTAVNEGNSESLFIPENPFAGSDVSGLQGRFSEIDYTFSYDYSFEAVSVGAGTIFYTFPERFDTTTELYGSISFDTIPTAPSATLYIDVDETGADGGDAGLYFLLGAGHSIPFNNPVFGGLDISGSLGFVNSGFSGFYYGADDAGPHDASLSLGVPISLGERWSASAFVTYSGMLGDFRQYQFGDARTAYRGTSGSPATFADTVWGGFTLSLGF